MDIKTARKCLQAGRLADADRSNKPPFLDFRHPLIRSPVLIRCIMSTSLDFHMQFYYGLDLSNGEFLQTFPSSGGMRLLNDRDGS